MAIERTRSLRGLLVAAVALVSASALAGEITLFQNRDFRGTAVTLQSPMLSLERNGFATASSAIVGSGVWEACTSANFQGQCVRLQPGEYRNINAVLNDDVASAREITVASAVPAPVIVASVPAPSAPVTVASVPAPSTPAIVARAPTLGAPVIVASGEPRIVLFERAGFGGRSVELTKTMGGLDRSALYAGADAAVVYGGVWRLCTGQYFRGECADFAPGRYENLGSLTSRVSSAELVAVTGTAPISLAPPPAAGRVVLFERPNFRGHSVVIDRSAVYDLQSVGFDYRAGSMQIESGMWVFCSDAGFQGECHALGPGQYASLPGGVSRRIVSARTVNDVYRVL